MTTHEQWEEEFCKGEYVFRFIYKDKDGKMRYEYQSWNDPLPKDEVLKNIFRHIDGYEGTLTDFVNNEYIKSFIRSLLSKQREEVVEKLADRQSVFDFIPQDEYGYKMVKARDLDILSILKENK